MTTPKPFDQHEISQLENHPILNKMFVHMDMVDCILVYNDPYECMVSQIIYQQVAFKVAQKSEQKLYDHFGGNLNAEKILSLTDAAFKTIGIGGSRVKYIRNFTNFVVENPLFWASIYTIDEKALNQTLIKIKGIGKWTIEMFLLFGLAKSDILSSGDLIIMNGLKHLYAVDIDKKMFEEIRLELKGFETITSVNLWKYMEQGYYLQT